MYLPEKAPSIFSADMLRSGSMHIQIGLCNALSWRMSSLNGLHGEGRGEQIINPVVSAILVPYGYQVFGGHYCAFPGTLLFLKEYGIKPIVVIRNLYDTILSCKERLDRFGENTVLPPIHPPFDWAAWDEESKFRWVAHNVGQWQLKFFVSWEEASAEKLWVNYNEFYANQRSGFGRILDYYELRHPSDEVMDFICGAKNNNFNRGIPGRGKDIPRSAKRILDDQAAAWGSARERVIRSRLYD
jgi:hypothetical protein